MDTKFELFMKELSVRAITDNDKRLVEIFNMCKVKMESHFNCSLPENNEWAKWTGKPIEFFGPEFHKGFRQYGVIDVDRLDMEVYGLISTSDCFWDAVNVTLEGK